MFRIVLCVCSRSDPPFSTQRRLSRTGGEVHAVPGARVLTPDSAAYSDGPWYHLSSSESQMLPHLRPLIVVVEAVVIPPSKVVGNDVFAQNSPDAFVDIPSPSSEAELAATLQRLPFFTVPYLDDSGGCSPGTFAFKTDTWVARSVPATQAFLQEALDDAAESGDAFLVRICPGTTVVLDAPLRVDTTTFLALECAGGAAQPGGAPPPPCVIDGTSVRSDRPLVRITSSDVVVRIHGLKLKARGGTTNARNDTHKQFFIPTKITADAAPPPLQRSWAGTTCLRPCRPRPGRLC